MFDEILTGLMDESGVNQMKLSKDLEIPQTTISGYVIGKSTPSVDTLKSISKYFGVSTDYLIGITPLKDEYTLRIKQLDSHQIAAIDGLLCFFEEENKKPEPEERDADFIDNPRSSTFKKPSIYFVYAPSVNRIKIGYSSNPDSRIEHLMTSSPYKLEVMAIMPGTFREEKELHLRFSHLREHREWFRAEGGEIQNFIKKVVKPEFIVAS